MYVSDIRWWATAVVYSYRAYEGSVLLANAVETWTHVTNL
jgi:hypothetical protein